MNSLRNRLYDLEQTPPAGAWERIAVQLDESHIGEPFVARVAAAEAAPPSGTWQKIAGQLSGDDAVVIPMQRRGTRFFRYAAAAALIGIVAFAMFKWSDRGEQMAGQTPDEQSDTLMQAPATSPGGDLATANGDNSAEASTVNPMSDEPAIAPARRPRPKSAFAVNREIADEPIYAYNEHTPNLSDRYVMLMTPNGIVRMSKKLGDLICCVAGEEDNEQCREQIRRLQEKMATTPVTAAPGNFMDILSLVSTLNDEEDL